MKSILAIVVLSVFVQTFSVEATPVTPNEKSKKIALTFDACMTTGMLKRIASGKDQPLYNAAIVAFLNRRKSRRLSLSQDFGLKNIRRQVGFNCRFSPVRWKVCPKERRSAENHSARVAKTWIRICKSLCTPAKQITCYRTTFD